MAPTLAGEDPDGAEPGCQRSSPRTPRCLSVSLRVTALRLAAQQQALRAARVERRERQLEERRREVDDLSQRHLLSAAVGPEAAVEARAARLESRRVAASAAEHRASEEARARGFLLDELQTGTDECAAASRVVRGLFDHAASALAIAVVSVAEQESEAECLRTGTCRANLRQQEVETRELSLRCMGIAFDRVTARYRQMGFGAGSVPQTLEEWYSEVGDVLAAELTKNEAYLQKLTDLVHMVLTSSDLAFEEPLPSTSTVAAVALSAGASPRSLEPRALDSSPALGSVAEFVSFTAPLDSPFAEPSLSSGHDEGRSTEAAVEGRDCEVLDVVPYGSPPWAASTAPLASPSAPTGAVPPPSRSGAASSSPRDVGDAHDSGEGTPNVRVEQTWSAEEVARGVPRGAPPCGSAGAVGPGDAPRSPDEAHEEDLSMASEVFFATVPVWPPLISAPLDPPRRMTSPARLTSRPVGPPTIVAVQQMPGCSNDAPSPDILASASLGVAAEGSRAVAEWSGVSRIAACSPRMGGGQVLPGYETPMNSHRLLPSSVTSPTVFAHGLVSPTGRWSSGGVASPVAMVVRSPASVTMPPCVQRLSSQATSFAMPGSSPAVAPIVRSPASFTVPPYVQRLPSQATSAAMPVSSAVVAPTLRIVGWAVAGTVSATPTSRSHAVPPTSGSPVVTIVGQSSLAPRIFP